MSTSLHACMCAHMHTNVITIACAYTNTLSACTHIVCIYIYTLIVTLMMYKYAQDLCYEQIMQTCTVTHCICVMCSVFMMLQSQTYKNYNMLCTHACMHMCALAHTYTQNYQRIFIKRVRSVRESLPHPHPPKKERKMEKKGVYYLMCHVFYCVGGDLEALQ